MALTDSPATTSFCDCNSPAGPLVLFSSFKNPIPFGGLFISRQLSGNVPLFPALSIEYGSSTLLAFPGGTLKWFPPPDLLILCSFSLSNAGSRRFPCLRSVSFCVFLVLELFRHYPLLPKLAFLCRIPEFLLQSRFPMIYDWDPLRSTRLLGVFH